jgi:hypothetical protein
MNVYKQRFKYTYRKSIMKIPFLLLLTIPLFCEDIVVKHAISNADRILIPSGRNTFSILAPGVGDVRSVTTYRSEDGDKVVVVERIVQVPMQQPYYQQPIPQQQYPQQIYRDDSGSNTYEYQGGNPFNKDSWKKQ